MSGMTEIYQKEVTAAHDFGVYDTVVDVGSSFGSFAMSLVQRRPQSRAILLDRPEIIAVARERWAAAGLDDRLETVAGDFFTAVPGGGDLYLLRFILHDWDDDECGVILSAVAAAAAPGARLAVVEHLLPEDSSPHHGWMFDMNMMVMLTGRERTTREYADLLSRAGFEVTATSSTSVGLGVIEARRRAD
jgi:hypothetical protein